MNEQSQPHVLPWDEHNQKLVSNVHPTNWENPAPAPRYNLVVIGAGTAGLVAAVGAAGLGAKVALIEKHLMGGDCLNVGCVPSKALLRAARAVVAVREAGKYAVHVPTGTTIDFGKVMERMRRLRADISPNDSAGRLAKLGVDVFFGSACFVAPDTIKVGDQRLKFSRAVIATGARATIPPIPGLAEAGCLTHETIFSLTELPSRMAVIGAGPIGCELSQAFQRFGSKVTLLMNHDRILPREDKDAARIVEESLGRDGVERIPGVQILRVEKVGELKRIHLRQGEAGRVVEVDEILVGAGRAPNIEGLDLKAAGVRYHRTGIEVDDFLRTSNPKIYAAGDICSKYKFTHAADFMARIVIQNSLFMGRAKASSLIIPWCTYTSPEIAHVGLYEKEATEKGIVVETFTQELSRVDRAILDGETEGFVRVHVRKGTDKILGATVVAEHAGDLIGELTLAMKGKLGLKTIAATIHPYPTQAEAIRKAGDAWNRTRLTPFLKKIFAQWLAWRR